MIDPQGHADVTRSRRDMTHTFPGDLADHEATIPETALPNFFFFPPPSKKKQPKKKIEIVLLNVQSIRKNETPTRLMKVEMEEFVSCRSLGTISRPPSRQLFYFMIRPNFFFFCYAGRLNSARVDGTLVIGELNSTLYYDKCSINSGVLR